MYRGINIDLNPAMKQKYDTYETAFAVGTKITVPAPTSCTTSDHIASEFTNGIQLMIQNQSGVMMVPGQLSAFEEDEVMPPFPSSYKVVARSKVQDTVVVVMQALPSAVTYCSIASPSTLPLSSSAAGGGAAASSALRSLSELSAPDVALIVRAALDFITAAVIPL